MLKDAGDAYRVLIESMNEGALTLTAKGVILYANQCFARMLKRHLEQVVGASFHRLLSAEDQSVLRSFLKQTSKSSSKIQVRLKTGGGSTIPAQISIRPLARNGARSATFGIVVTDMSEVRKIEERLRALTHRVVQVQEAERGRVALELHDNITQLLCAILVRGQTLADKLSVRDGPAKIEAMKLRALLGQATEKVESISRNLRPGVLDELGLVTVLNDTSMEFAKRTGISVKVACAQLSDRLPAGTELALYRIFQEALRNVEKHAHASRVTVRLQLKGAFVQLMITDDGIGFNQEHHQGSRKGKVGIGLLGMRERASYAGGTLIIKSILRGGTEIMAQIPLQPGALAA